MGYLDDLGYYMVPRMVEWWVIIELLHCFRWHRPPWDSWPASIAVALLLAALFQLSTACCTRCPAPVQYSATDNLHAVLLSRCHANGHGICCWWCGKAV